MRKILIGFGFVIVAFAVTGCGSSNDEPQSQLPPHIQQKRDKEIVQWHEGLNAQTKGKGFVESLDIQREYQRKHGTPP